MTTQKITNDHRDCGDGFLKSSFSESGNCVAVAVQVDGSVKVRNSNSIKQPTLLFTPNEWTAFIKGVKHGEFEIGPS